MENITIEYRNGRIVAEYESGEAFTVRSTQDVTSQAFKSVADYAMEAGGMIDLRRVGATTYRLRVTAIDEEKGDTCFTETDKAEAREQPLSDVVEKMQRSDAIEKEVLWNGINKLRKEVKKIRKHIKSSGCDAPEIPGERKHKRFPCPCGKIPSKLVMEDDGPGAEWATVCGDCCGEWHIEFRSMCHPIESIEFGELAIEAWNEAPRPAPTGN